MKRNIIIILCAFTYLTCTQTFINDLDLELMNKIISSSKNGSLDYFIMPESDNFFNLPNQDPTNPVTAEKVNLGKLLFFETALAQNPAKEISLESYSCSSCHIPSKGFLPGRIQGIADGGSGYGNAGEDREILDEYMESEIDAQGNRPLTVMNSTYVTNTLWSGLFGANDLNRGTEEYWTGLAEVNKLGFFGLEAQNIEGFDLHRLEINEKVLYEYGYASLFDKAFPEIDSASRYSPITASFAMGAYLRTLLTNEAPFQDYLKGDKLALTENQKIGASLFFGKAECITCHNSPSFSSMNFYKLGTADMYQFGGLNTSADDPRILGRALFTGKDEDRYKFKVPQLYNLKDYVSFFHGSSKASISSVVNFKLNAQSENPNVPTDSLDLSPKSLTNFEINALVDFLQNALHDDNMERYKPESVLSNNCFPNNDPQSQIDLGCN